MDRHLAMVRATGLRSARVGSEVGVEWLATGECDGLMSRLDRPDEDGRALFFVCSFLSFDSGNFGHDFPTILAVGFGAV